MSGVATPASGPRAGRAHRVLTAAVVLIFAGGLQAVAAQVVDTTAADTTITDTTGADTTVADTTGADFAPTDTTLTDATVADTSLADTTLAATRQVPTRPPVGFDVIWWGRVLTDSLPALLPALDLVELIGREPGSFTYWFGTTGWPDGWSFRGLPPHASSLSFNDLPFTHLFTGRPAHQLVPLAIVEPPELRPTQFGSSAGVVTRVRPFAEPQPVTEAKYWRGGDGLQSIDAVHAQHRQRPLFGNAGVLNVLGAYSGRAADGEYPGSRLRRARQVLLRIRYEQLDWSVEIFNLHNRRNVGAHGGVIPDPGNFESIYIRPGATVESPDAWRRIVRNDLAAKARMRLIGQPSTVSLFWTAETFRYTTPLDTLGTASDRVGLQIAQPLVHRAGHRLAVAVSAWRDGVSPRHGFAHPDASRGRIHASIRDTLRAGGWLAALDAGMVAYNGRVRPVGAAGVSSRLGAVVVEASAAMSDDPSDVVAESGFGSLSGAAGSLGSLSSRFLHVSASFAVGAGPFRVQVGGFASRRMQPWDYFAVGDDSAAVMAPAEDLDVLGGYAALGWRRDAERGMYATAQSTLRGFPRTGDALTRRMADSMPSVSGRSRLGARFVLFQGDLDVDAYAEGIAWSSMRSRMLHPQTGLLIVPVEGARIIGPSHMLHVGAEARVRDATLFFVYENALSGTALMTGNLIVPVYPLPAQRFRFGVFWPIFG